MSPARWRTGLVVGKFSPLHLGHEALIHHALSQCDEVVVLGYSVPEFEPCDALRRRQWLHERFPQARSIVLDDATLHALAPGFAPLLPNGAADSLHQPYLAALLTDVLQLRIDVLFGSEAYVQPTAQAIAHRQGGPVEPALFDLHRVRFPICGTQLRRHPHRHRHDMAACVYRSFVQRVCLLGGESTGKTTLAARLAQHYATVWAPEYGREHWEARGGQLTPQDLLHIAETQIQREQDLLAEAHQFLFCDTSPLTTLCYSVAMFGEQPAALVAAAARGYAQVLLCEPDFDFVQDGTRRDDAFRAWQQRWYETALADAGVRYTRLTGSLDERMALAVDRLGPPEPARHRPAL
ncbi:AAA family ATPase [Schlegelella sp. S2-27]|uniref:AAA family ATPase n=1 Tax=Caldimonas mangrovi TaxID=2944811 RepID=A0ABT0YLA6_9BURK|nr:AAA family ATPase [Caldimonas mangrovi]MCM5679144.1 AAA family ATPase [Caldimonas mangrovi]